MEADTLPYLVERYPLLITKLYVPRLDTELLARPHLLERLDQAASRPLALVTAPAGWGKTTLVANWARQSGRAVGWISLDEGDNDLARFWLHIIAALQQIRPSVGEAALTWFYAREAPPVESRLAILINDLALAGEAFVLVMDDVHTIWSAAVHDSLAFFVEHQPPNVHLTLISRSELPLPLARWRAGRLLVEFDSQDLRFSAEECAEFLHTETGYRFTTEQAAVLANRTEGWAAGLQLVALALQAGRPDVQDLITHLGATSRYIFDYLSKEVLDRQEPEIQEFLLKTSVLERLSGELCDAVTGSGGSQRNLETLVQLNLFIIALDEDRRWFRYHHLFRDFLYSQLRRTQPGAPAGLHRRAAQWFAAEGLPHEAVSHAMAAMDYELAGRIILQYGNQLWRREEYATLRGWLEALPGELRDSYPDLCLLHAWSLFRTLGLEEMDTMLSRAEALLQANFPPLGGSSNSEMRGILATIQAATQVVRQDLVAASERAQIALDLIPPEQNDWRYAALLGAGLAHYYQNEIHAARQAFEEAFKAAVALKRETFYGRAFSTSWLARTYMDQGYLRQAKEIFQEALTYATGQSGRLLPTAAWALTGLGELCYLWNELELAEKYFQDSLALSTQVTPSTAPPYLPLARLASARGDLHAAEAHLFQAARLAEMTSLPSFSAQVRLFRVWFALQQGDLNMLQRWMREMDLAQPIPGREALDVMAARAFVALQDYPKAAAWIEKLQAGAEAGGRGGVVIELLILQALVLQGQGRLDAALKALQRAVELGSRESFVRVFIDEGEAMRRLLQLLAARSGASVYTAHLLGAFARQAEAPDALNERETEILRLLANGLSNAEIGKSLFITVGTVKWHANHIYSKLGVKNRGQAVAKARELKLIPNSAKLT